MSNTRLHPVAFAARLLHGGWSASGTALVAVFVAIIAGSATYLGVVLDYPTPAPDTSYSDMIAARRAVDQSRSMFTLLSTAAVNATGGVDDLAKAVPQIFDAVDSAHQGAQQAVDALDSTPSASAAAGRVASATAGIDSALSQVQALSGYGQTIKQATQSATDSLRGAHIPDMNKVAPQLGKIDAAAGDVANVAGQAGSLRGTLSSMNSQLQTAAAGVDASIASARASAVTLRDGLAKIAAARPKAIAATDNLVTGLGQLKTVLGAIDGQLGAAQQQLPNVPTDPAAEQKARAAEAAVRNIHPLPMALADAAIAGLITYGIASLLNARSTRRLILSVVPSPLANLAADRLSQPELDTEDLSLPQYRTVDRIVHVPANGAYAFDPTADPVIYDTDPALSVDEIRAASQTKIAKPARIRAEN